MFVWRIFVLPERDGIRLLKPGESLFNRGRREKKFAKDARMPYNKKENVLSL